MPVLFSDQCAVQDRLNQQSHNAQNRLNVQPTHTIRRWIAHSAILILLTAGCQATKVVNSASSAGNAKCSKHPTDVQLVSTQIEMPHESCPTHSEALASAAPRSVDSEVPTDFRDITLAEVISLALQKNDVLKDLGGRVLSSPDTLPTIYDPAIREADPLFGTEGALSAFDTQWTSSLFWTNNNRAVNNITLGGGTRSINQDLGAFSSELSKTSAAGTRFSVRNLTQYDASNQPGNQFTSGWDTQFEIEARQPLLQGAGVDFNRIAGPNARPGFNFSSGVLIARTNTDISLAQFESGVRDFVAEVEDAYWELYFAYRSFDSWMVARNGARQTWKDIKAQAGLPGGTAEREARARVQYFVFQDLVQDALTGNARSGNSVGIYRGERRLRMLIGLPGNDGELLRPADEPQTAAVDYAWDLALEDALFRRPELRQQKWRVKQAELRLKAAKNFLKPRLDAVALGRARGFGDDLAGGNGPTSFRDLGSGDHQEWQAGFELSVPLGFRQAHAGVRQAELQLMRDRAILREQEVRIAHDLGDSISEVKRAHASVQTNFNRLSAARERLSAAREVYKVDNVSIDLVLDAQQEVAESQSSYFRAATSYEIAKKDVALQTGTLLSRNAVQLREGPWSGKAYCDAHELGARLHCRSCDALSNSPGIISRGTYPQQHYGCSLVTETITSAQPAEELSTEEIPATTVDLPPAIPPEESSEETPSQ